MRRLAVLICAPVLTLILAACASPPPIAVQNVATQEAAAHPLMQCNR